MKVYQIIFVTFLLFNFSNNTVIQSQVKKKNKLPKYSISASLGYNYVLGSAGGDVYGLSIAEAGSANVFDSPDLGMQQGLGL